MPTGRRRGAVPIAALAAALILTAFPPSGAAVAAADPVRGERLFSAKGCGQCHTGRGPGRGGATSPPEAGQRRTGSPPLPVGPMGVGRFVEGLWNHAPTMRALALERGIPWPQLTEAEMADLMAYLRVTSEADPAPDLRRGQALLVQKGCLKCHALSGEGGRLGPDLARVARQRSRVAVAAGMWSHAERMLARIEEGRVPFPVFGVGEMGDLLGYLAAHEAVSGR